MLSIDEDIKEYGIHYQIIEKDGIVLTNTPVQEIVVPSSVQEYHFMNMLSNVLYQFSVFAINEDGIGVKTKTEARTCKCPATLYGNYFISNPYVRADPGNNDNINGILPEVIDLVVKEACGMCPRKGGQRLDTVLDLVQNGKRTFARKSSRARVFDDIDDFTQFSFPLNSNPASADTDSNFVPVVKYPGAVLIVRQPDTSELVKQMILNILGIWPIFLINALFIILSGGIVWALENYIGTEQFQTKPRAGVAEGIYWAYVTQTTVGYGDFTPVRVSSRIFAVIWILISFVMASILLGSLTTAFLTTVSSADGKLYGTKVAAMSGSFEETLAIWRNAKVDKDKQYDTIQSLVDALMDETVDAILIDAYKAGDAKNILSLPTIRPAKLIEYPRYYGFVFSGALASSASAFEDYIDAKGSEIMTILENTSEKMEPQEAAEIKSIFDQDSPHLRQTLIILTVTLIIFIILGLALWFFCFKERQVIAPSPTNYEELVQLNDQSKEFNDRILERIEELTKKMDTQRVKLAFDKGQSSLSKFALKEQNRHRKVHRFNRTELALGSIPECSVYHLLPSMQTAELIKPADSRCNSAFFATDDNNNDDSAHVDENTTEITQFIFHQNDDEDDDDFIQETERNNDDTDEPPVTNRSETNDSHQPENTVANDDPGVQHSTTVTIHPPPESSE
eukprot:TCONS_00012267-protein